MSPLCFVLSCGVSFPFSCVRMVMCMCCCVGLDAMVYALLSGLPSTVSWSMTNCPGLNVNPSGFASMSVWWSGVWWMLSITVVCMKVCSRSIFL